MARTYRSIPEPVYARKSNELVKEDGSVVSVDNLQEKLTAGENITIDENNVISASGGTAVVANPTLAGTEADLTGLQVGETKYKVPSGGGSGNQLYQHNINIRDGRNFVNLNLITSNSTAMTVSDLISWLKTNGFSQTSSLYSITKKYYQAIGFIPDNPNPYAFGIFTYVDIEYYGADTLRVIVTSSEGTATQFINPTGPMDFVDTVITL